MQSLKNLSEGYGSWLLLGLCAFLFVVFSHFVLQEYLMLPPCEQCVYIRYAFIVLGIGCWVMAIYPLGMLRYVGILICVYALIKGISAALVLDEIQQALQSETFVFGLKGCSLSPTFDFNLPLDSWIPQLFAPLGFCGYDVPIVGEAPLSPLQEWLITLYSEGWYLIPTLKFGTMAQCAIGIFIFYVVVIAILFLVNFLKKVK